MAIIYLSDTPTNSASSLQAFVISLAPGGVYKANRSPDCWWALTSPFQLYLISGCVFSVALSLGSPPLTVS